VARVPIRGLSRKKSFAALAGNRQHVFWIRGQPSSTNCYAGKVVISRHFPVGLARGHSCTRLNAIWARGSEGPQISANLRRSPVTTVRFFLAPPRVLKLPLPSAPATGSPAGRGAYGRQPRGAGRKGRRKFVCALRARIRPPKSSVRTANNSHISRESLIEKVFEAITCSLAP